jgi:hypothetical protein
MSGPGGTLEMEPNLKEVHSFRTSLQIQLCTTCRDPTRTFVQAVAKRRQRSSVGKINPESGAFPLETSETV